MYLSNNYVDINIYPLTMNVMRLWACLYGKGAISNDNIIIIIIITTSTKHLYHTKHDGAAPIAEWSYIVQWLLNVSHH